VAASLVPSVTPAAAAAMSACTMRSAPLSTTVRV
jgi:hypothetical protein